MKYRPLGKTGMTVSSVGVGTWQFSGDWGHDFTQAEVDPILDQAEQCGINLIDTAECYGDHLSEKFIGNWLARRDRSKWIIATKFGHCFDADKKVDAFAISKVCQQLEDSLRALKTDFVDVYQFHSGTDAQYFNEELWEMLNQQKVAGKIRSLGLSVSSKGELTGQVRDAQKFGIDVIQIVYNRIEHRAEQLYFPHAECAHLGVLARVPLAHGLLGGKYTAAPTFSGKDWRVKFAKEKIAADMREVEQIRAQLPQGIKLSQWALAWCLKNQAVSSVIPGCRSATHVKENAAAADLIV